MGLCPESGRSRGHVALRRAQPRGHTDGQAAITAENFWLGEGLPLREVDARTCRRFHSGSSLRGAHVCANDLDGAEERITLREPISQR
jgi:hypothetical protein